MPFSAFWESGKIFHYLCNHDVFSSRRSSENFDFLETCPYDSYKIWHSHSTSEGASACTMAAKSHDWDLRKIAKIVPKLVRKRPFLDFFRFSQKLSIRMERIFLSHTAPYEGPLCAITSKSYGWDLTNIA